MMMWCLWDDNDDAYDYNDDYDDDDDDDEEEEEEEEDTARASLTTIRNHVTQLWLTDRLSHSSEWM